MKPPGKVVLAIYYYNQCDSLYIIITQKKLSLIQASQDKDWKYNKKVN